MIKKNIQKILDKPMDRKDFLKHIGVGILGLFGIITIIKSLGELDSNTSPSSHTSGSGYGTSRYGQ